MEPTAKHFAYLDDLRESGETNMFGAGVYVQEEFGLGRKEAGEIVRVWMKTFDIGKKPEERAAIARAEGKVA